MGKDTDPISFEISKKHKQAIETLAGGRRVRLSGRVVGGQLVVDFVACNAAFVACNAAFSACNAAFTACNAPFKSE